MKKIFTIIGIFLLAAGCAKTQPVSVAPIANKLPPAENLQTTTTPDQSKNLPIPPRPKFPIPTPLAKVSKNGLWTLVKGDPADTCTWPTYTGNVKVSGWYVWGQYYNGQGWILKLSPEDAQKFPLIDIEQASKLPNYSKTTEFGLEAHSDALEKKLRASSSQNPVALTVTKFFQYCEDPPGLTVSE